MNVVQAHATKPHRCHFPTAIDHIYHYIFLYDTLSSSTSQRSRRSTSESLDPFQREPSLASSLAIDPTSIKTHTLHTARTTTRKSKEPTSKDTIEHKNNNGHNNTKYRPLILGPQSRSINPRLPPYRTGTFSPTHSHRSSRQRHRSPLFISRKKCHIKHLHLTFIHNTTTTSPTNKSPKS